MRVFNPDGEIFPLEFKRLEQVRATHLASLVLTPEKKAAAEDAVMFLGGLVDRAPDCSGGDVSVFDTETAKTVVKDCGEVLYQAGGTALMIFVADLLWTIMNQAVSTRQTHHSLVHYEIFLKELNMVWRGIGNTRGKPIVDYWEP